MTGDPSFFSPKRLLAERGLSPRKRLGQNFLVDQRFAGRIAGVLPVGSYVVEIGGGTGALTAALLAVARGVDVLEVDRGLAAILRERFADAPSVRVIEQDALEFDLAGALSREAAPRAVCGNLPYYITTPLLERIVACSDEWETSVLMVQREYGRRLSAAPGTSDYSSLTVFVKYHCRVEHLFDAGAGGFYPAPAVASSVMRLTPKRDRDAGVRDPELVLWLSRAAFAQRRKTLVNSVLSCLAAQDVDRNAPLGRDAFENAVRSIGKDANIRGERLSLDDFIKLANALHAQGFRVPRQT